MKHKFLGIAIIALAAVSCESSGNNRVAEPVATPPATFTPATTPAVNSPGTATTTITPPASTNSTATVALNPAHGAPGHRCEIPVGAPLNGTPGNAAAAAPSGVQAAPMMQLQTPAPSSGQTVRLNPAHGAPGHDCAIPVGQPLKN